MGSQKCGARKSTTHLSPQFQYFLFRQASLVRESENMVRDTTTRLERAAGELEDLIVRIARSIALL